MSYFFLLVKCFLFFAIYYFEKSFRHFYFNCDLAFLYISFVCEKSTLCTSPAFLFLSMLCDIWLISNFLTNINIDYRQTLRVDYLPLFLSRLTSPLQTLPKVWLTNICFLFVNSLYTCFYNIENKVNMMRFTMLSVT